MIRLLFFLLFPYVANSQTGAISGNAYWKYNDYVGNKGDAGAEVYLFKDSLSQPQTVTCDLLGNYKIDGLQPGNYLLVIRSKNVVDNWFSNIITMHFTNWLHYTGYRSDLLNQQYYDSFQLCRKQYFDDVVEKVGAFSNKKHQNKMMHDQALLDDCRAKFFERISKSSLEYSFWGVELQYPRKMDVKEITVSPSQTTSVVTDFGVTYI